MRRRLKSQSPAARGAQPPNRAFQRVQLGNLEGADRDIMYSVACTDQKDSREERLQVSSLKIVSTEAITTDPKTLWSVVFYLLLLYHRSTTSPQPPCHTILIHLVYQITS